MTITILSRVVFVMAAGLATVAPLAHKPTDATAITALQSFPGWPDTFEGRPLTLLPLSDREKSFAHGFPGQIARFWDGKREVIIRYVAEPTRRLHPASDCLRGLGYSVTPLPARRDQSGVIMSCLKAERQGQAMNVCEYVKDSSGQHWPDVSSWYWNALVSGAAGPWWSFVVSQGS